MPIAFLIELTAPVRVRFRAQGRAVAADGPQQEQFVAPRGPSESEGRGGWHGRPHRRSLTGTQCRLQASRLPLRDSPTADTSPQAPSSNAARYRVILAGRFQV